MNGMGTSANISFDKIMDFQLPGELIVDRNDNLNETGLFKTNLTLNKNLGNSEQPAGSAIGTVMGISIGLFIITFLVCIGLRKGFKRQRPRPAIFSRRHMQPMRIRYYRNMGNDMEMRNIPRGPRITVTLPSSSQENLEENSNQPDIPTDQANTNDGIENATTTFQSIENKGNKMQTLGVSQYTKKDGRSTSPKMVSQHAQTVISRPPVF